MKTVCLIVTRAVLRQQQRCLVAAACIVGAFLACPGPVLSQVTSELVAASGQQAAGMPAGVRYSSIWSPYIDSAGNVAFAAGLTGSGIVSGLNHRGVWYGEAGSLSLVARAGDPVPGAAGATFYFDRVGVGLSRSGQVVINASVRVPGPGQSYTVSPRVWSGPPGALAIHLDEQNINEITGFGGFQPSEVTIGSIGLRGVADSGEFLFDAYIYTKTIYGVDAYRSLFSAGGAEGLSLVYREGMRAPGSSYNFQSVGTARMNAAGEVAFATVLDGGGPNANQAIYGGRPGSMLPRVIENQSVPSDQVGIGSNFTQLRNPQGVELGDDGTLLFGTDTNSGVFAVLLQDASGRFSAAAKEGEAAPGMPPGVVFDSLSAKSFAGGKVAIEARLAGPDVTTANQRALFVDRSLVARQGSPAAGVEPDTAYSSFFFEGMNARGQVAFSAYYTGASVTNDNGVGLYGTDPLGRPQLIVRKGDVLSVAGSDKIVRLVETNRGTSSLPGTVLSDSGRLAYTVWFADGTNAAFVADLGAASITDSFTVSAGESFDVPGPLRIESGSDLTVSDGGSITTPDLVIEAGSRVQLGSGAAVLADRVTNNGVFAGPLSVSGSQVYGGAGVLEGFLEVSDGGTQAPGNSPGIQTMETLQWGGGGVLELEISDAGGVAGAGWDLITVADALEITADEVAPFTIKLSSLGPSGTAGTAVGFDPARDSSWRIANAGSLAGFSPDVFTIDASDFQNPTLGGTWTVSEGGSGIDLNFTAGVAAIDLFVGSGIQTQGQLGFPVLSGTAPVVKTGAGTLVLDAANTLAAPLTINGGTVLAADAGALGSATVTIAEAAKLGISSSLDSRDALQIEAFGSVLGNLDVGGGRFTLQTANGSEASLEDLLEAGRNGGGWDGERGIVSATAAAESAAGIIRGVGWKENPDGSITVAYAAPGDVNLDGEVDIFDMVDVTSSGAYGEGTASVWSQGDFDYNGVTDIFDLVLVSGAGMYGAGYYLPEPALASSAAAVPEPSLAMLVLAAAGWLAGRGRRQVSACPSRPAL